MYQRDARTPIKGDILPKAEVPCRNCGKPIPLYDEDAATFVRCNQCKTLINLEGNHTEIQKLIPQMPYVPIEIGSLCTFNKILYKVIGYSIYNEFEDKKAFWTEYVLLGADGNYKILSNFENHFNLFDYTPIDPALVKTGKRHKSLDYELYYKDDTYNLMYKYKPMWQCSFGEIPYDPQESGMSFEYVRGPFIITRQKIGNKGHEYTRGEYMNRWEMKEAFGKTFEAPSIIATNRTIIKGINSKMLFIAYLVFIAAASILVIVNDYVQPEEIIFQKEYLVDPNNGKDTLILSNSFDLKNGPTLLALELNTPSLQNNWLASFVTLVNEETNTQKSFEIYTSYYSGTDGGEKWTEGKTKAYAYIDQVEDGKYHVMFEFEKLNVVTATTAYFVLSKNPSIWKNFWFLTLIAGIIPLIYFIIEQVYFFQKTNNSNTTIGYDV